MNSSLYQSFKMIGSNQEATMTSLEVVDLINKFREEEGKKIEKIQDYFIRSIRKGFEILVNAGIEGERNFTVAKYIDKQVKQRKC